MGHILILLCTLLLFNFFVTSNVLQIDITRRKAPPLWCKPRVLLEEKFRKFNFSVTLTLVKCSVATWDLTWWAVQVREGFLEEVWELGLEGWQSKREKPSQQENRISKAYKVGYKVGLGYLEGNQDASGPGTEGPGLPFCIPSTPPSSPQDTGVFWEGGGQEA